MLAAGLLSWVNHQLPTILLLNLEPARRLSAQGKNFLQFQETHQKLELEIDVLFLEEVEEFIENLICQESHLGIWQLLVKFLA